MFKKGNQKGRNVQSRRKGGLTSAISRNLKKPKDLRSTLDQTKNSQGWALKTNAKRRSLRLVDARQKISTKSSRTESVRSISLLDVRRKNRRSDLQHQNRSLTLLDGGIQVTTRQEIPPDRFTTVMGDSIRVTAKVERNAADRDRKADVIAGFLTITAKNEEARRKEKENEARMKRQKEVEERKRERENEARKRERREKEAKRRGRETEVLLNRATGDGSALNVSDLYSDTGIRDSVFEGRLGKERFHSEAATTKHRIPTSSATRIAVSNLHPLVTQQDVEELFGVVGQLRSCKMLGRGSAEVVYERKEDATFALTRYHNRKLDGQPMQCRLSSLPSPSLYSPPPARLEPLPPLRPREASSQKLLPSAPFTKREARPYMQSSRPVVFKVKI